MSCCSLRLPGPFVPCEALCREQQEASCPRGGSQKHTRRCVRFKGPTSTRETFSLSLQRRRGFQQHQDSGALDSCVNGTVAAVPHVTVRRGAAGSAGGPHRNLSESKNVIAPLLESTLTCRYVHAASKGAEVVTDSGHAKGGLGELGQNAGEGALHLECASLSPFQILRADYAAWRAWYEEQQDVPSRLLRILSQGGSALGGYATSWGQPERAEAELQQLSQAGASLAALLFFGSSEEKMEREIQFYTDGTVLLTYQLRQDLPLLKEALLNAAGAQDVKVDPRRLARLRRNLVSLLPFLVVVVNTFPLTPLVLTTLLRYVPRDYLMPAAYDEQRLKAYRRLRKKRASQAPSSFSE